MKDEQMSQLVPRIETHVPAVIGEQVCKIQVCKINIAGYSLDNFQTLNPEGYTILCRFGEASNGFSYFPNTAKIVLDSRQQSMLINNFEQLVPNIAEDLQIPQQVKPKNQEAFEKSVDFFSNTQVTVQPNGIQGKFYNLMQTTQNYLPMAYTSQAVSYSLALKTTGMTGAQVIAKAPLTFQQISDTVKCIMVLCFLGIVVAWLDRMR